MISAPEGSIITEDGSLVAADGTILAPPGSVVAAEDSSHHQQVPYCIWDFSSVTYPDPGSGALFLTPLGPGSGMGKKIGSGSGMNNVDHISESLETIFLVKILKFFDADPVSGIKKPDPG